MCRTVISLIGELLLVIFYPSVKVMNIEKHPATVTNSGYFAVIIHLPQSPNTHAKVS